MLAGSGSSIADIYYDLNDLGQALAEYQKVVETPQYDDIAERAWLRIAGIRFLRDEFGDALNAYRTLAEKTSDPRPAGRLDLESLIAWKELSSMILR